MKGTEELKDNMNKEYDSLTDIDKDKELEAYIESLSVFRKKGINEAGSLVLCCEHFTNGHRYLIENAAKYVSHLYCFIADDYQTDMSFNDRFRKAIECTKGLKKVTIVPGSKFAVSFKYFYDKYKVNFNDTKSTELYENYYKNKDNIVDIFKDAVTDVTIFAKSVAPALGIKKRFSGGEPAGRATHAYNSIMQDILSQYNIDYQIIPKTASSDIALIESLIKNYIEKQQFGEINELVPPVTFHYLKEHYEIPKIGYKKKLTENQIRILLSTISDFGGNIFDYFLRRGMKELYVYGSGVLIRHLHIMASANDNIQIKGFVSSDKKNDLIVKPYLLSINFQEIENISYQNMPVLIVNSIEPKVRHKLEYRFSKLYFIDEICTHEFYMTCCVEPLIDITREAGAGLLFVNRVNIGKNHSNYEDWLVKNINKIPLNNRCLNDMVFENAFSPIGYDREYMQTCFTAMPREKHFYDNGNSYNFLLPPKSEFDSGVIAVANRSSMYLNCSNGMRHTEGLWPDANHNIYFLGHTVAFGIGSDDSGTIESHLQKLIKEKHANDHYKYNVLNYANSDNDDIFEIPRLLRRLPLRQGDIAICLLSYPLSVLKELKQYAHLGKTRSYFERPHDLGEIFIDRIHMNSNGYKQYAVAIYDSLIREGLIKEYEEAETEYQSSREMSGIGLDIIDVVNDVPDIPSGNVINYDDVTQRENEQPIPKSGFVIDKIDSVSISELADTDNNSNWAEVDSSVQQKLLPNIDEDPNAASDPELFAYLVGLSQYRRSGVTQAGAVILTAGPFTYGHRHLVECVASLMQHVYVFIAEDGKSVFPFEDRLRLVKEGIHNIPNATVIPGGRFIITSKIVESQFAFQDKRNPYAGAEADIEIFARYIATALNITSFFTGERSPDDGTVRRFDSAMRAILPRFGVDYKEIPRREYAGKPISSTLVRTLLREQRFSEIERLAPPSTLTYLRDMYELPSWQVKKK